MSEMIEQVIGLCGMMSVDEKLQVRNFLNSALGDTTTDEPEKVKDYPSAPPPRGRRKGPLWFRLAERIDRTEKGTSQVVGNWIRTDSKLASITEGTHVLVGVRYPKKMYSIGRVAHGVTSTVEGHDIANVVTFEDHEDFGRAIDCLERELDK